MQDSQSPLQGQIPQPPDELFVTENVEYSNGEKTRIYFLEKIECIRGKGILVHRVGALYPEKGWPTPEALHELGKVKRLLRESIDLFKFPSLTLGLLFYDKNKLLNQFIILFDNIYRTRSLNGAKSLSRKMEFLCPTAVSMFLFISGFLKDCGYNKDIAEQFAFRIAQIPEMDDAYRYRIQDLASCYEPKNAPRKEIKRLGEIYWEREHEYSARPKIAKVIKLVELLLLVPKYNKAFKKNAHYITGMALDEGDKYWCSLRSEYDYDGKTYEEKQVGLQKPQVYEATI